MRDRIIILLVIYTSILFSWCLGRAISGDETIYVLGLDYLGVWLFSPLLFFIPWVLFKRNKLGGILLVIPLGLFIWYYGLMFVPRVGNRTNSQVPFSIMTFNIQETNDDLKSLLMVLESNPVEILALQEVTGSTEMYLNESLVERYPYHVYYRPVGLAVYSQYPIHEYRVYPVEPRPFQSFIIDIGDSEVHLINSHLARAGFLDFFATGDLRKIKDSAVGRAGQIKRIMEIIASKDMPAIMACDCNMTNLTRTYKQITSYLQDAFRTRGWGLGHTFLIPRGFGINSSINLPFQRIDYLFHSPEFSVQSIRVISTESGSDHRPILARFVIR